MERSDETPRWRDGTFTEDSEAAAPAAAMSSNLAGHVRVVAVLLIVQGVLESLAGLALTALAVAFPAIMEQAEGGDAGQEMPAGLVAVYSVLGGGLLVIGLVRIVAGWRNYGYRSRTLGIVAMAMGLGTAATCYCAPTSIGLAIYGLIVYLSPSAAAAFHAKGSWASDFSGGAGESPFGPPDR